MQSGRWKVRLTLLLLLAATSGTLQSYIAMPACSFSCNWCSLLCNCCTNVRLSALLVGAKAIFLPGVQSALNALACVATAPADPRAKWEFVRPLLGTTISLCFYPSTS